MITHTVTAHTTAEAIGITAEVKLRPDPSSVREPPVGVQFEERSARSA